MGGYLSYEFIQTSPLGVNSYKITLTTFTNCEQSGPNAANPPYWNGPATGNQSIGIYEHDISNNPTLGGNKNLLKTVQLIYNPALTNQVITAPPSNCIGTIQNCIYQGKYEAIVDLGVFNSLTGTTAPSSNGYHVVYESCCRNNIITNLTNNGSMCIHTYIPSDFIVNNSPSFSVDSLWVGCVYDTSNLTFSTFDSDGDNLVLSFGKPLNGNSASPGNPLPSPSNILNWPIVQNQYNSGYSLTNPFGYQSFAEIYNSQSKINLYAENQGFYCVSITAHEYRNNVLIGVYNYEIQLMFMVCSSTTNSIPTLDNSLGTTQTQFSVAEQDTLCFDFGFSDIENDSILLVINGDIFDSNLVSPPASITNFQTLSAGPVINEFCWSPSVGQASGAPYTFNAIVYDLSCDNNYDIIPYQITVTPSTLNIREYNQTIKAYPNPTEGKIKIELQKGLSLHKIELYNLNSEIIAEFQSTEIVINKLKKGAYFLKVYYGNKIEVLKIFKQ